ncbi:nodulin-related protein 1 [Canna indica]|uniref:Nodulin-related protein 1 n=1 Tax=Canna indica TaxID=4628 RepID=A0AAQ3L2A3_9LILI|nr:nodulin-related protein 1 [Canna indica]
MASEVSNTAPDPKTEQHSNETPDTTELLSSAKLVADAAKSALGNETDKLDKAAVAGAAADLLGAASHYGKLSEGQYGKYVEQAETYLEKYSSGGAAHPPATTAEAPAPAPAPADAASTPPSGEAHESSGGGGGMGDFMKIAQGFLK